MLFNSYIFIFAFLPATLAAVAVARRAGARPAMTVLVTASLLFYGWFVPGHIVLLLGSVAVNYGTSRLIHRRGGSRAWLTAGIAANIGLLGTFKYLDFLIGTVNGALGAEWTLLHIILPLAISFFTFQQIAYLVDVHRGLAIPPPPLDYTLFVCFFPQLIAGPIVHHSEIVPQFRKPDFARITRATLAIGLTWFTIGLAKKTLLADSFAPIAEATFSLARDGAAPSLFEAWFATLAFAFQIYFDFSGYSDMAIGLALIVGLRLPLNFDAPYRAASIIDFWRRWHMTLSRFLRDYLYIPLGGNRLGEVRREINLMITMLLGGLWHGAAWTFVAWGGLHGLYLSVNHVWGKTGLRLPRAAGWLLTMIAVCVAWTFFRAESFAAALTMTEGLFGLNGIVMAEAHRALLGPLGDLLATVGVRFEGLPQLRLSHFPLFAATIGFVLVMPTTQKFMGYVAESARLVWRPTIRWATASGIVLAIATLGIARTSEFLYFQF